MIRVENIVLPSPQQWEAVVRGVRNPMNSWDKSDSAMYLDYSSDDFCSITNKNDDENYSLSDFKNPINCKPIAYVIGEKDLKLMQNLANAGADHGKFLRMLPVIFEITAPMYWFKQLDAYKVGIVTNSTSLMHKMLEKPFELSDFYINDIEVLKMKDSEVLNDDGESVVSYTEWIEPKDQLIAVIGYLNRLRDEYFRVKDTNPELAKDIWLAILERIPQSYMQTRTVALNYQTLRTMYHQRKNHKLGIWAEILRAVINPLPYGRELIIGEVA